MPHSVRLLVLAIAAFLLTTPGLRAQTPAPTADQIRSWVALREARVNLLRDEIKQTDTRIESRLDGIVDALKSIGDSKDSRTKVARMKEDTMKGLMKTIAYYDQKRAALREELRNPRLQITEEEKRRFIAIFDARIEKRTQQIMALCKSMPTHQEHERYRSGAYGYERNPDYDQSRRMSTHTNQQRDAIIKELDRSIARLDQQTRTLRTQAAAATSPGQIQTLSLEIAKNQSLTEQRRKQRLEALKPVATPTTAVGLKEAIDMDTTLKNAVNDLRRDFNTLFLRYNTFLPELSELHATEAAYQKSRN